MKKCVRCLLPENKEGLSFDEAGVCNVCRGYDSKSEIDWKGRKEELDKICDSVRGKGTYDCMIPFSGGKDSTFQLWYVITQLKLRPLVACFDHGFFRPNLLKYRERTFKKLGCDFITMRANPKVVKEIIKVSIQKTGDFCWHCHNGVYGMMTQVAKRFDIPLILWGQATAEYGTYENHGVIETVDMKQYGDRCNMGISPSDMFMHLPDWVTPRDMEIYRYPEDYTGLSVRLGSFIQWDAKHNATIIKRELNWEGDEVEGIPPRYWWEKIECGYQGIRDYLIYLKKGFGRTAHLVAIDIREGRLSKEEGQKLIDEYDGKRPASLDSFLEMIGSTEEEFMSWVK